VQKKEEDEMVRFKDIKLNNYVADEVINHFFETDYCVLCGINLKYKREREIGLCDWCWNREKGEQDEA
jgi:hypothetical protein